MALRTYITEPDAAFRAELRSQLQAIDGVEASGEGEELDAAAGALARGEVDLLIVALGSSFEAELEQVRHWKAEHPALVVFACSSSRNPDILLAAMRAGISEWLDRPLDAAALAKAIERASETVPAAGPAGREPTLTTCVFSLKGGQGVTTLAVNTAVALSTLSDSPGVLVDLSFGLGEPAAFLDLHPQYSFANFLGEDGRADPGRLQSCLLRHTSGVFFLGEPESLEEPSAVSPAALREVLTLLQESFSYVVIDLAHVLDGHTYEALGVADRILLVANCEVLSARATKHALRLMQSVGLGAEKVRVVLNRANRRDAITPAQFAETVKHPVDARIPDDYEAVIDSINAGEPLVTSRPKVPVSKAIRELAQRLHAAGSGSQGAAQSK